jgi:hypothetical protein
MNINEIDLELIEDICLFKYNRFLCNPIPLTLKNVRLNKDFNIIASIELNNTTLEFMDLLITRDEYLSLLRQKKINTIIC